MLTQRHLGTIGKMQVEMLRATLSSHDRKNAKALVSRAFTTQVPLRLQQRIGIAKLFAACLPFNLGAFSKLLRRLDRTARELQFTVFCYLDLVELPRNPELRNRLLAEIKGFMINAQSDPARSVWMAGDLLGDHWRTRAASRTLNDVYLKARHECGRSAAKRGLKQLQVRTRKR
jgi:hypothetical protein